MGTRKRIAVHGLLAAGILAVIGWMYAQLAGMYTSRPVERSETTLAAVPAADVRESLAWRVPAGMAAVGFLFVLVGEGLLSVWRKPTPAPSPRPSPEDEAEALLQRLLEEAETKSESRINTDEHGSAKNKSVLSDPC